MKVLHVIPATFEYFDDIRTEAFALVETLQEFGVTSDTIMLQYSTAEKQETRESIKKVAPSRPPSNLIPFEQAVASMGSYDVVHIHYPMFGGVKKIIAWLREHPEIPLVITSYRQPIITDLFSWVVLWYNAYYTPKLYALADVIAFPTRQRTMRGYERKAETMAAVMVVDMSTKFMDKDLTAESDKVQLTPAERLAWKYSIVYRQLVNS